MCGIICALSRVSENKTLDLLDISNIFKENIENRGPDFSSVHIPTEENQFDILFGASVLWLQGNDMTKQPVVTEKSVLLFNGDIFNGPEYFEKNNLLVGDTALFLETLESEKCSVRAHLSQLQGPYSFIYLNKSEMKLYFGRDVFGRRSLLLGKRESDFVLTSVATKNTVFEFIELPAIGIFSLNLNTGLFELFLWDICSYNSEKLSDLEGFLCTKINVVAPENLDKDIKAFHEPNENELDIFDSIKNFPIDKAFDALLKNDRWLAKVKHLQALLENSVKKRVTTQPKYCRDCITSKNGDCRHCLTGVLFSGGIDCAILALLVDKFTEAGRPIDLLNVAFDRVKDYNTPDRLTGLQTLDELKKINPNRQWNFIEINVTTEELNRERCNRISNLIYPLNTVLDDSLGCALWFAARGCTETYRTPCRILITGMGADELFGGYTRHRSALNREGWKGLHSVLEAEWENIPYRNLGRDDRVVSDHGRQLRLPYLDENVVGYVRQLKCWEKTCPVKDLPQGFGEKILLRSLGYYLGLRGASGLKKRALQFGSRIANPKENAHEVSKRL